MTLTQSIAATTKSLTLQVRINSVLITPTNPTDATGVPGISGIHIDNRIGQAPTCSIEVNRTPSWITRGMPVTVDVGYDGFTRRRFTGTVQDRNKGIGKGTINCVGSSSPLYTTSIIPDRDFSGQTTAQALGSIFDYVGISSRTILTTRSPDVSEFTMGTVTPTVLKNMSASQMVNYIMELQGCKIFETGAGITVVNVIDQIPATTGVKTYTTNNDATARILTTALREDPTFVRTRVKVTGATPTTGDSLTATAEVGGVSPLVKPPLPALSYIDAGIFNSLADTQAKCDAMALFYLTQWHRIPKYLDIDIPGDPELECGMTIGLVIPEQDINGYYFVDGWQDTITIPQSVGDTSGGYRTTLTGLRGGDDLGGTLTLAPVALFTMVPESEVFGTGADVWIVLGLDASASYDPDGSIASYAWSSNKTTTPVASASANVSQTIRIDGADLDGTGTDWTVTLTVTDNDAASTSVTLTVPYTLGSQVIIPAMGLAYNSGFGFTPDGGQTWNDITGATCISVGLRPSDGVHFGQACFGFSDGSIKRTTDGGLTSSTVLAAVGSAIMDIQWDWRNGNLVWAITDDCRLYLSLDEGVTWVLYEALRTTLGLSGALGNKLGLPAGAFGSIGVYIFGGTGTGTPLIAYDTNVGAHAWVQVIMTGDPVSDFPADATLRIVDYCAQGGLSLAECMILSWASGGGGSIQAIYQTTSPAGTSRAFTRATGLTAGLKNGKYIVGNAPLAATQFHAAFGDRDIWSSVDGIAWTKGANIMPSGVTPNHAVYAAGILTGIPDIDGLYLIAAENAGNTLGLYKSADDMQSVTPLRPAGGAWSAWPSSGKGKKISLGAPGIVTSAKLAKGITNGILAFDGNATWATQATISFPSHTNSGYIASLRRLSSGDWLLYERHYGIWHSSDGITWTNTLPTTATRTGSVWNADGRTVLGYDVAANGDIFAVMGSFAANADNDNGTLGVLIKKSTDHGATWSTIYTDAGWTDSGAAPNYTNTHAVIGDGNDSLIRNGMIACDKNSQHVFVPLGLKLITPGDDSNGFDVSGGAYSTDGTTFLRRVTSTLPQDATGLDGTMIQYVASSRLLIVGSSGGSTPSYGYYSDNDGANWTAITTSFAALVMIGMAQYFTDAGGVLYAFTSGAIYKSIDNGANWTVALATGTLSGMISLRWDGSSGVMFGSSGSETFSITNVGITNVIADLTNGSASDIGFNSVELVP